MERRDFLKKAGMTAAGALATTAGLAACAQQKQEEAKGPAVQPKKTYEWKMVTTWPPNLPVLQTGAERFAKRVEEATGGQLKIQVFAGGELVPPLGVFDAVSDGTVECGSGASYYWAGKVPAAQWFAAVPFGFNPQGINAWFYSGGGLELWEEVYAPFNVIPRPQGNTGVQMGGWFRKDMNTIDDYKGLKMRIPGLGGKVISKAGGTVVLLPGGEIFTSLERGVIDATEWVGPMHDLRMGFYKAAKNYYYPGWHEPGTCLEVMFNKKAYESLPVELQQTIDAVAAETNMWSLCEFEAGNGAALQKLISEHNVNLVRFPEELLAELRALAKETLEEEADKDPMSRKVHEAFKKFKAQVGVWGSVSENAYYNVIADKYALKK
ncbi:MAG: TRAP transporter substrate-binding protein [Desulfobacterales bacterium]|nr:TRAP transporter substrate-binding protein [Desulfobacterales bacterium]MDJ0854944.1 TRAP transporter substrate-binding protein [Desulfobacterales bacterium]MDJ0887117.1 TRAP transporter substrate-binding protein [Desulfobacterales bacterium]MDJ0990716.1 TRAP transporter substrate-binding protein [Desulfobacterales bacterium]